MDLIGVLIRRLHEMAAEFVRSLPQLVIGLALLILAWLAARSARKVADRLLGRTDLRASLANLVQTLIAVTIWVLGILIAMSVVLPSVTPANLLAALGLGSVAIGFAFKDIFENFLAGVLIMLRKSMRIGDMIECEKVAGRVELISLRDTHIRVPSNELLIVPNAYLYKNPMKILTEATRRRYEVTVGVGYDGDLDRASDVIRAAVEGIEAIDKEQRIDVLVKELNASSVDFAVRWWTGAKPLDGVTTRDQVLRAIKAALDTAGIEIPYPYQTLTFKEPLPIAPLPLDPVVAADAPEDATKEAESNRGTRAS